MAEQQEPRELVTLSRAEAARVLEAGKAAREAGKPATACPYSPTGDGDERVRTAAWLRGWVAGGPPVTV